MPRDRNEDQEPRPEDPGDGEKDTVGEEGDSGESKSITPLPNGPKENLEPSPVTPEIDFEAEDLNQEDFSLYNVLYSAEYQGPLPMASELKRYQEIDPTLVPKIIEMADSERGHRHEMDNKGLEGDIKIQSTGQWMAYSIYIFALIAGMVLTLNGHILQGAIAGGIGLSPVVQAFLKNSNTRGKKKLDSENPDNPPTENIE